MSDEKNSRRIIIVKSKNSSSSLGGHHSPQKPVDQDMKEMFIFENSSSKKSREGQRKQADQKGSSEKNKYSNFNKNYQNILDMFKPESKEVNVIKNKDMIRSPVLKSRIKSNFNEDHKLIKSPPLKKRESIAFIKKQSELTRSPILKSRDNIESLIVKRNPLRQNTYSKKNVNDFQCSNQVIIEKTAKEEATDDNGESSIRDFMETVEEFLKKIPKLKPPCKEELEKLAVDVSLIEGKKIVVFDLDETLVHCETKNVHKCEVVLNVNNPNTDIKKLGLNLRPYLKDSLLEIKKYFQIFVFTASQQTMGDIVLDYIDPERKIFDMRLYRHHCYQTKLMNDIVFIKDLRILRGVDLKDVVIVDNSVLSFCFLLDNGIPIMPYHNNKNDTELIMLVNYLKHLSNCEDVRIENRKNIKLDLLYKQANNEFLSSEESHYVSSKNSNNDKEVQIKNFSSENSNFSNFSNELEAYKKSDDSERASYKNSSNTNRSDKTFKDQLVDILGEFFKTYQHKK